MPLVSRHHFLNRRSIYTSVFVEFILCYLYQSDYYIHISYLAHVFRSEVEFHFILGMESGKRTLVTVARMWIDPLLNHIHRNILSIVMMRSVIMKIMNHAPNQPSFSKV